MGDHFLFTDEVIDATYVRAIVAHATGGHVTNLSGMSLNDACVAITEHHNRIYAAAQAALRKDIQHG